MKPTLFNALFLSEVWRKEVFKTSLLRTATTTTTMVMASSFPSEKRIRPMGIWMTMGVPPKKKIVVVIAVEEGGALTGPYRA